MSSLTVANVEEDRSMPAYADALRAARIGQGRSLDDAAQLAGVRPAYLEALERAELDRKLSPGYVKSMLVRYGDALGLSADELLRAYDAEVTPPTPLAGPTRVYETHSHGRAPWRKRLPLALGACAAAALVVLAALELGLVGDWSPLKALGVRDASVVGAPAASTNPAAATTPTATPATTAPPAAAAEAPNLAALLVQDERPPVLATAFTVRLRPREDVWLELTDAETGEVVFEGTRAKGDVLELALDGSVKAVVGRPLALSVFFNGRSVKAPRTTRWLISSEGVHTR